MLKFKVSHISSSVIVVLGQVFELWVLLDTKLCDIDYNLFVAYLRLHFSGGKLSITPSFVFTQLASAVTIHNNYFVVSVVA